ncbi:TIGR03790 family protein [Roseateles koreensis]|uniref:TIGR03790 family protein n=1 Tax=Roseateles koreensis TaxID=2987526 RepID=A0ABT5KVD8_9BURK|nr:TIGR03790 family protein [Roseateles koreensis]MDC8786338.1 TIGR03790 family protein [Roseateles koreensis]
MMGLPLSFARAQEPVVPVPGAASAAPVSASAPAHGGVLRIQRLQGRITASELGLVVNLDDPYSVAVGAYYARQRGIPDAHIAYVHLPVRASLSPSEFEGLQAQLKAKLGLEVQALALAWTQPYAVACNSITGALALGFQAELCSNGCAASKPSPYLSYAGAKPFTDLGLRPSMLLAARSVQAGRALIDRGIAADQSLPGFAPVNAYFVATADANRNVRAALFPPPGKLRALGVDMRRENQATLPPLQRVLIYQTGLASVPGLDQVDWMPGALADHLTSFGGQLEPKPEGGQMSALDWLESGATASYGTVSEPCNHLQKFPQPQLLLFSYVQGLSALEAYWHSVAWPGQGVFVGEPLAAPFAPRF